MKVIECGTQDRCASKESLKLWHITKDKNTTLCGYNKLFFFTGLVELEVMRNNLCPDCFKLAQQVLTDKQAAKKG